MIQWERTKSISVPIPTVYRPPASRWQRLVELVRPHLRYEEYFVDSVFAAAIKRLDKMLADMEKSLADSGGPWLLGKDISLADIGYAPYVTRLDQLKFLSHMIAKRPKTAAWYEAMKARKPYQDALAKWFNPKYLPLMDEKGTAAWPKVQALLAA